MKQEYVHLQLGEDIVFLAGYYTPLKELRLKHDGREVLCVVGTSCVESSCCGNRSGAYAIVPGYIVAWKHGVNEAGLPVSEVEPITDETTKREVAASIRETECIWNVDFW